MKNSPVKDQGDILRHVYTPKVNLEDGVFEDVEGSKKMDAIKQFQKRTDEKMEIGIKNTLKFTESVQNKVDEMLEIASITDPDNEEFKRIAEYKNERIMKAFKPGKTQPERTPPTELETVRETPENELEANMDGNVGGGGNENELEANLDGNVGGDGNENEVEDNMDENVGGDGNENEIQNIWLNSVSLDKVNVITEENLESNLVNSKKGNDCDVDMGNSMDEGKETNLDGVLKEGDNDINKRDKESTFSQILTKMKNKKHKTMDNEMDELSKDAEMDELSRVVDIAVADTLQEKSMTVGRKESTVTRSMDAQLEKAARKNKPKSVEYMDVEINEKRDSAQYQQNVDNNDQTIIQNKDSISNDVNVDVITNMKTEVDIIDNKKEENQDIVRRYEELPKKLITSFGVYLQSVGHPNGIKMAKAKPKIMHMDWQTTTNYLDAGVFVMRHLECFNGRKIRFNA
ncbi:hypothetical protein Tco_0037829, partial [Tanacetum coccineum]